MTQALLWKMTTGLRHIATEPANLSNKYFNMDKKRSPLPRNKIKSVSGAAASDSVSREATYKCCKVLKVYKFFLPPPCCVHVTPEQCIKYFPAHLCVV